MIELKYEDVVNWAREGVQERGEDFVYQSHSDGTGLRCRYFHDGRPDCFVGYIFDKAGIQLTERFNAYGPVSNALEDLIRNRVISPPAGSAYTFLVKLQDRQDSGCSWGESLADAIHSVEGFRI